MSDHGGVIPSSEWWIKVVADKGQGMTNLAFSIINQIIPNSPNKHFMLFVYEGDDSHYNLKTVFDVSF